MNNQIRKYSLRKFKGVGLALAAIGVMSTSTIHVNANELVSNDVVVVEATETTPEVEEELKSDDISSSKDKQKASDNEDGETLEAIQAEDEGERFDGCNCQVVHTCGLVGLVGAVVESTSDSNSNSTSVTDNNADVVGGSSSGDVSHTYTGAMPENSISEIEAKIFEEAYKTEESYLLHTPYSIDYTKKIPSERIVLDESQLSFDTHDPIKRDELNVRERINAIGSDVRELVNGERIVTGQLNSPSVHEKQKIAKYWNHAGRLTTHVKVLRSVNIANWSTLSEEVDTEEEAHLVRSIITPYMYADAKAAMRRAEIDYENYMSNNTERDLTYLDRYQEMKDHFAALTNRYNRFMGVETPIEYTIRRSIDQVADKVDLDYVKNNVDSVLSEMPAIFKQYANHMIYLKDTESKYYAFTYSVDGRIYINIDKFKKLDKADAAWVLYHEIGHVIDGRSFISPTDNLSDLVSHRREKLSSFSRRPDFEKINSEAFPGLKHKKEYFADSVAIYAVRKMNYFKDNSIYNEKTRKIVDDYITSTIIPVISVKTIDQYDASKIKVKSPFAPVITTNKIENDIVIPIENETIYDNSINVGENVTLEGSPGLNKEIITITYENGIEKSRSSEIKVVNEMRKTRTIIGTKPVIVKQQVDIPFSESIIYDDTLNVGSINVEDGANGVKEIITTKTLSDGAVSESVVENVVSQPRNKVKRIGTKTVRVERSAEIQFEKTIVYDESIDVGEKIETPGQAGRKTVVDILYFENNEVKKRTEERIESQPINAIQRVGSKQVVKTETFDIDFNRETVIDPELSVGETQMTNGVKGRRTVTTTKYLQNGEIKESVDVQIVEPTSQITKIGSKPVTHESVEDLSFKEIVKYDNELLVGEIITTEGSNGRKTTITTRYLENEEIKESTDINLVEPVDKVITYGTKQIVNKEITKIGFNEEIGYDDSLNAGLTRITTGSEGQNIKTTTKFLNSNNEVEETISFEKIDPVNSLIIYGTKPVVTVNSTDIDFNEEIRYDDSLNVGEERIIEGVKGQRIETTTLSLNSETLTTEQHTDVKIIEPINKVIIKGSKPVTTVDIQTINFEEVIEFDSNLNVGEVRVTDGVNGQIVTTLTKSLVNGEITESRESVKTEPVNKRIIYGSKEIETTEINDLSFDVTIKYDDTLNVGEVIVKEGSIGREIITKRKYLENTDIKELIDRKVLQPINKQIIYGSKPVVETEVSDIPFETIVEYDNTLNVGEKTISDGENGQIVKTKTTYLNENNETEESIQVETVKPVNKIITYGVKEIVSTSTEELPASTEVIESDELFVGEERIETGKNGYKTTIVTKSLNMDTHEIEEKTEVIVENAKNHIKYVGIKENTVVENATETNVEKTLENTTVNENAEVNTENTVTESTNETNIEKTLENTTVNENAEVNTEDTENTVTENTTEEKVKETKEETLVDEKVKENTEDTEDTENTVTENITEEKIVEEKVVAVPNIAPTVDEKPEGVVPPETSNENENTKVTPLVEKTNEVLTNDPVIEEKTNEVLNDKLETTKSNKDEKEVARVTDDVTINTKHDVNDEVQTEVDMKVNDAKDDTKHDLPKQKVIEPEITKESNIKQATDTKSIERQESTSNENTQQTRKTDKLPVTAYKNDSNYGAALVTLLVATGILTSSAGLSLLKKFK